MSWHTTSHCAVVLNVLGFVAHISLDQIFFVTVLTALSRLLVCLFF